MVITRSNRALYLMIPGAADRAKMVRTQANFSWPLIHGVRKTSWSKAPSGTGQLFPHDWEMSLAGANTGMSSEFSIKGLKLAFPDGFKLWGKCEDTNVVRMTWNENKLPECLAKSLPRAEVPYQADCWANGGSGSPVNNAHQVSRGRAITQVWLALGVCLPHNFLVLQLQGEAVFVQRRRLQSEEWEYLACAAGTALIEN